MRPAKYVDVYPGFPNWKTYHKPSKIAVQYTFLLRQKRELQQFVESFNTQVPSHAVISSCSILDKNINSELDTRNISIYFFDKSNKALLLKYFVKKSLVKRNCNNLILFYSKHNITFQFLNSNIYVNTDHAKWEQFYSLFEFLLMFSSKSILEIQFYVAFVCKDLISKELNFWYSLCSIDTNIARYKKNENLNWSLRNNLLFSNLPKEAYFKMKNSVNPTNLLSEKFMVEKVDTKLFIKEINTYKCKSNLYLKRKSVDSENGCKAKIVKVSHDIYKNTFCKCSEKKWKMLRIINQQKGLNYTKILEGRELVVYSQPTHIQSNVCFDKSIGNESMLEYQTNIQASLNKVHCAKINLHKVPLTLESKSPPKNVKKTNITNVYLNKGSNSQLKTSDLSVIESDKEIMPLGCESVKNVFDHSRNFHNRNGSFESNNKEEKIELSVAKGEFYSKSEFTAQASMVNTFSKVSSQFVSFQTAAGKSLNVSEKALKAAQRLFEEVCSQEIELIEDKECNIQSNNVLSNKNSGAKENKYGDDMNATLVENFFEEIPFDEKVTDQSLQSAFLKPSITSKIMQPNKKRKSLGGRRSLKPYSSKN